MRIGILRTIPTFSFSMDVYADGLVRGLNKVRPDWEIIEFTPKIDLATGEKGAIQQGLEKYYERYWRYPIRLKQESVDLFHIIDHSDGHLLYWLRNWKKPTVITCHDLINWVQPETFKGKALLPAVSMTAWKLAVKGIELADQVVSVSTHTKTDIVNYLDVPPEKVTVVPNAVEPVFRQLDELTIEAFREEKKLSSDTFYLLNVGSNNLRKNVLSALKAAVRLREKGIPIGFLKTGADFTSEQKTFIASSGLAGCVRYLGKPDQSALIKIYNAAHVLIAPSTYEGFGLTILEAMACGTPVVTSNVTSLPEVAGKAAILVDPMDIDSMVESILRLYKEPATCDRYRQLGLDRVASFTWEKTAEQVANIYESIPIKERVLS
ncbi:MAG: glycosyltransferase family 1 protein [Cyanobacteria bacterium P01_D01_bin.1]